MRFRDKLKIYLHYHNTYDHQTLQGGKLPGMDLTHNVI